MAAIPLASGSLGLAGPVDHIPLGARDLGRALAFCALIVLLLALAPAGLSAAGRSLALVGATVIDGTGAPPIRDAVVVIDGQRIAALGPRGEVPVPEGAEVVPVDGKWLVPGFVDAHVHFFQSGGLYARPDIIDLRAIRPYPEEIRRTRDRLPSTLARYLASGVTSVVDVGGPMWTFGVRKRAKRARFAPRVAVAGPLLATAAPPELAGADPPIVRIGSPEEARAWVRRLLPHAPDLIKIWFVFPGPDIAAETAWVRAAVAEAHAAGIPVVAHATQARAARAMIEASVDVLAHSVDDRPLDDGLLARMKETGVVYTTTLSVQEGYREVFGRHVRLTEIERRLADPEATASFDDLDRLPRRVVPSWVGPRRARPLNPIQAVNLRRVRARGIAIAAGSDAGNIGTPHGPALHREMELMAEAGLDPMDILVAATQGGARVMGRTGELGTLEVGKLADLVVLDADPLVDIRNTQRIHRVIKGGEVFDPGEIEAFLRDM
ncbi:MAG: amidohydrolase family protein [Kiloniellaceae bacterium]